MTGTVIQREPRTAFVPPGGADLLARDMTAIFAADITLATAQEKLAEFGQWLPADGDPDSSLGSLVEQNSTGPLRLGYGGWRDLLLGAQFTNGKGELITAGGRTVKNVAGYDLTKFMVGQHGIFGKIVTLTTRTYRRPDAAILAQHEPDPAILAGLLASPLKPQWSMLTRDALFCGYLSDSTTLVWYEQAVRDQHPASRVTRQSLQADIDFRTRSWNPGAGRVSFRASVPPAKLKAFVDQIDATNWIAEPAFGIMIGSINDDSAKSKLSEAASGIGGRILFGSDPNSLDVSTTAGERQIIEQLKKAFDPDSRLQPLPWLRT